MSSVKYTAVAAPYYHEDFFKTLDNHGGGKVLIVGARSQLRDLIVEAAKKANCECLTREDLAWGNNGDRFRYPDAFLEYARRSEEKIIAVVIVVMQRFHFSAETYADFCLNTALGGELAMIWLVTWHRSLATPPTTECWWLKALTANKSSAQKRIPPEEIARRIRGGRFSCFS